jgi:hypothetical protein
MNIASEIPNQSHGRVLYFPEVIRRLGLTPGLNGAGLKEFECKQDTP